MELQNEKIKVSEFPKNEKLILENNILKDKENTKKLFSLIGNEIQNKYCEICKKTFSTTGNLRNHIMTMHQNIRPFECPFPGCDKKYSIQTRLQVHYRTHIGKKPYICSFCSKAFNEKGNLKTHERFHSEIRPFKCNECSKTYKTNGHLKDHIEIHHRLIKKFQCEYCNKKFGRISTLKSHIKTHTGEKKFKCHIDTCNQYFAEKGNMEIHYKRHMKRLMNNNNIKNNKFNFIHIEGNSTITRPSSNFTLYNFNNNNNNNNEIFSSFRYQFNDKNNSILIYNNDYNIPNLYNNNINSNNFLYYENVNFNFNSNNIGYYFNNNIINNNEKNELNYFDSFQDINSKSDKGFDVNLDN